MAKHIFQVQVAAMVAGVLLVGACSAGPGGGSVLSGYTKLDDMEGGDTAVLWASPTGPSPLVWWTATDCAQADRISPPPYTVVPNGWSYAELPAPIDTFPGITSTHAARVRTTSTLTGVWGAQMGFDPAASSVGAAPPDTAAPPGQPCHKLSTLDFPASTVDLSKYKGMTFWAKAETPGEKILTFALLDRNTDPRGGLCNAATPDSEADCYNGFRSRITLSDTFTRYTVDFSTLVQDESWGFRPTPDVVDLAHVYSVNLLIYTQNCGPVAQFMCAGGNDTPLSFDLWVDDIYLVAQ